MVAEDVKVGSTVKGCKMIAGRKLLVGMKLTTSCREMLTWTIAKLAQPGDHILAVHVSSLPSSQSGRFQVNQNLPNLIHTFFLYEFFFTTYYTYHIFLLDLPLSLSEPSLPPLFELVSLSP